MILSLSLTLLVASLLALVWLVWRRVAAIRSGALLVQDNISVEMLERWQERIDNYYFGFGLFFKSIAHYTYFYLLVVTKTIISIFRHFFVTIEKHCARLIESAHHNL